MRTLGFLMLIVGLLLQSMLFTNCANIVPPMGGPRDSIPAILVNKNPKDSTINFSANKITLVFSEYIELQNQRENIIVSPTPKTEPVIEAKLRTITIRIKDTLEPNTTYSINFGNSIKDITEGNISKELTYLFSTGNKIDSFELMGNVIIAQTGKIDTTLIAMLHRSGVDSAVIKENPRYIAKLNSEGQFSFRNLPAGKFYLYALKEEGGQRKYFSGKQAFAFNDSAVTITGNNKAITLYAFVENEEKETNVLQNSKNIQPLLTGTKTDKRLKFTTSLENQSLDLLGRLEFEFQQPLKSFDTSKITFTDDAFKPIYDYALLRDTSNKKFIVNYQWKENTAYHLIVDKDFAEDSAGRKIPRTDTLNFSTMKNEDYGNLKLRFPNIDFSKKPVLLLLQGEDIKFSYPITFKEINQKLFRPGEYSIRILWDSNGNGKWDGGTFFGKRVQPEKVENIDKNLNVKANWDNDVTIELPTPDKEDK
jgi:methionine-rich copper-binding protein CopC